jgi:predicted metal-dependent hydrolase
MGERDTSARVKPEYLVGDLSVVVPNMSGEDWVDFQRGLDLFGAHKFWDSHEAWELIWRRHQEPSRIFFQGLIQLSAACHQVQRGVYHGAVKHCNNALLKLRQFPDGFLNVGVSDLVLAVEACRDEVERLGGEGISDFNVGLFPVIGFTGRFR